MFVRICKIIPVALLAGLMAACGGGGGGGTTNSVSGTAATGAAIATGTVTMHCVSGTSTTTTTLADGSFTVDAAGITFPCIAVVGYKDTAGAAQQLHTYVAGPGSANITPITELIVANLLGTTPAQAYDAFDAAKVKAVTGDKVVAAIAAVKAYLQTLGVAVTDFPADPIGTRLVAKAGAVDGDKADKVLDDLQARLKAAGKKVADAAADLATGTPGVTTTGSQGCTGAAAAAFAANKGSYTSSTDIYTPGPQGSAATVLGLANNAPVTIVVSDNCTVTVGTTVLTYKSGSYTAAGVESTVSLTGVGAGAQTTMDFFAPGGVVQVADSSTLAFANFFFAPK